MFPYPIGFNTSPAAGLADIDNVYSMAFDGVDDYVDLGSGTDLELTDDFSVSAWIKDTSDLNRGIVCCGDRSNGSGWMMWRTSAHKAAFAVWTVSNRIVYSTTLINTGDWFNIIGTFEKNGTANQQVKIYINGNTTAEDENGWSGAKTPSYGGTIYKQIGFPYSGSNYFEGNIDEVSVFNYLLSPSDITEIYNATSTGKTADLSSMTIPPIAWYRMGD